MGQQYLSFYRKHGISPVSQDISDIDKHFYRRAALYRHLGIPPALIQGKAVLEFGPGSGHNATFTASLEPKYYVLVDGNPNGLENVAELVPPFVGPSTSLEIVESLIEEYSSEQHFDVVLCEGVIPSQKEPGKLLQTVSRHVRLGGILVITCFDKISVLSESLRRLASHLIVDWSREAKENLEVLCRYWEGDLKTLDNMSRPVEDWVWDNILNPMLGTPLSIPQAIDVLDRDFDVYESSPHFFCDWRWYKDLTRERAKYNDQAKENYWKNVHCLLDYRELSAPRPSDENKILVEKCEHIYDGIIAFENESTREQVAQISSDLAELVLQIRTFSNKTAASFEDFNRGLESYLSGTEFPQNLGSFSPLFGRGQQYLSFIRSEKHT